MKFRIIEYENGFGEKKYQVEEKGLIFWRTLQKSIGSCDIDNFEPYEFTSIDEAKKLIKNMVRANYKRVRNYYIYMDEGDGI